MTDNRRHSRKSERGNVLFIILLAIVLIGLLTAAIQMTNNGEGANIDDETLAIRASEVQRYASELERAAAYILRENGRSEVDLRFAHPEAHADYGTISDEPGRQLFARAGGAAAYRDPPPDVNNGDAWEFYGGTHLPGVGSDKADLIAVLPNVTLQFCEKINALNGQSGNQPEDTGSSAAAGGSPGDCLHIGALGRFDDGRQFYDSPSTPNTADDTTFTAIPALQACVQCPDMAGAPYHFYHVLLSR